MPDLGLAGPDVPERLRRFLAVRHAASPALDFRPPAARYIQHGPEGAYGEVYRTCRPGLVPRDALPLSHGSDSDNCRAAGAVRNARRVDHRGAAGAGRVSRSRPAASASPTALLLLFFALTLPWSVIGFWNAAIGFFIMRFAAIRSRPWCRRSRSVRGDEPITASTAIADLRAQRAARPRHPQSRRHDARDRSRPALRGHVPSLHPERHQPSRRSPRSRRRASPRSPTQWRGRFAVTYRRRTVNTGFKAGNFWDFCERWGGSTNSPSRSTPTAS